MGRGGAHSWEHHMGDIPHNIKSDTNYGSAKPEERTSESEDHYR